MSSIQAVEDVLIRGQGTMDRAGTHVVLLSVLPQTDGSGRL